MRTLLIATLSLQLITAAAVVWLATQQHAEQAVHADRRARAARHAAAAEAHAAAHRFVEAQLGYERATRIAGDLPEAEGWLDAARRSLALATVQRPDAPGRTEYRPLKGLAAALRAAGDDTVAEALDIALLRGQGLLGAAMARADAARPQADADATYGVWLRWQYATLLLHADRAAEAVTELEQVVRLAPEFADGYHRLGLAYLAAERKEAGIAAFQKALTHGAGPGAARDLARAFMAQSMWAEATQHLETVLRADPGDAEALRLLGAAQYQLKRYALAADTYRKAYRLAPEPRTLLSAVIALQAQQAWGEALGIIEDILPQAPRLPEIRFHYGVLLEKVGRAADARAAYAQYLTVAAGHPDEAKRVQAAEARIAALKAP